MADQAIPRGPRTIALFIGAAIGTIVMNKIITALSGSTQKNK